MPDQPQGLLFKVLTFFAYIQHSQEHEILADSTWKTLLCTITLLKVSSSSRAMLNGASLLTTVLCLPHYHVHDLTVPSDTHDVTVSGPLVQLSSKRKFAYKDNFF